MLIVIGLAKNEAYRCVRRWTLIMLVNFEEDWTLKEGVSVISGSWRSVKFEASPWPHRFT